MTPDSVKNFAERALSAQLRLFGVACALGWSGDVPQPLRALLAPVSRRQSLGPAGFSSEHDSAAYWFRTDPATSRHLPEPQIGMLFTCASATHAASAAAPPQTYRIDEIIDNPAAPFYQVGLTAL